MIKKFKKFLLTTADWAGTAGFIIGFAPLFLLWLGSLMASVFFLSNSILERISMFLLLTSWSVGILLMLLFRFFRKKYIAHVSDYLASLQRRYPDENDTSGVLLLKVEHDKVVDSGEAVWSKGREGVYPILLPCVSEKEFTLTVPFKFGNLFWRFHLEIRLRGDFDPQELYDHVIGHGFQSVRDWLSKGFQENLYQNPRVTSRLNELDTKGSFLRADAMQDYLMRYVSFPRPLNNIVSIIATVIVEPDQVPGTTVYFCRRALD